MSAGRGRGRGRGNTLPAWMTHGDTDGVGAGSTNNGGGYERDGRRGDDNMREGRGGPSGYYDRDARGGIGRDDDNNRDREYDNSRNMDRGYSDSHRNRDFDKRSSSRDDYHPQRQGRNNMGLGFDERSRGGVDREISWDRDRGGSMGRGRGRSVDEMNFVRGRDDRVRDVGRDSFGRDSNSNINMDREQGGFNNSSSSGMGRGRGRGRGVNINQPAWMTSGSGPVGDTVDSNVTSQKDDTMEKLLAQARQLQQDQTKRDNNQRNDGSSQRESKTSSTNSSRDNNNKSKASTKSEEEMLQKRRQFEAEEAAKKAEEERKRLEQLREEEEQRQLRALVGDLSDDEKMKEDDDNTSAGKKRKEKEEEEDLFEFETEEEREERLARKRREERKKKLRKLEETLTSNVDNNNEDMKVDQPRNAAGVIESELNDANGRAEDVSNAIATNNMEEDSVKINKEDGNNNNVEENNNAHDSGADSFDIFATDNATPVPTQTSKNSMTTAKNKSSAHNAQECDDAEGYYKANIGEIITLPKEKRDDIYHGNDNGGDDSARFRVLGIIGKGVFSSVIKCVEETKINYTNTNAEAGGRVIAMKIIRNNEIMAKAAAKEMRILRMLCHQRPRTNKKKQTKKKESSENDSGEGDDDDDDAEEKERRERENHNIVRLLDVDSSMSSSSSKDNQHYAAPPPEFRSHCIFLFEFMPFNLREVLSKFGKNVGINLTAVRSYGRQLLCALAHLERHRVVHADLKPDNILVSGDFSTVKLADFGSAFFETDHDNDPTPYLVSRFYRPPEVILGLEYDRMVDLWSLSVTLAELFTGSVLFPGLSNNDMLVRFMHTMGPFSYKMVKRHSLSYTRMGLQPHFEVGSGGTYQLRKQDVDRVTGKPVCRLVNVLSAKADARLAQVLLRASKGGGTSERVEVLKFADFLSRSLALDPSRRLSVRDALKHDFQQKKKKKDIVET